MISTTSVTELLREFFQTSFAVRTLTVGSLVSVCAALLGVTLVLKRASMLGDGISHAGFGIMGIALVLGLSPLVVSTPLMLVTAFLLMKVTKIGTNSDAAIALVSVTSLAVGVIALSRTSGNTDVQSYMFGSVLSVTKSDFVTGIITSSVIICLYIIFRSRVFAVTFDEDSAKATGVKTGIYSTCLACFTAVVIVTGMRIMGAMLISGLLIFPA
ncbi:MAG: metal ABC transporter permease, partial [Oscillospiraceae bacterium]|nr:metal ABC transporter permease [Oscillospiraceae bacterium]